MVVSSARETRGVHSSCLSSRVTALAALKCPASTLFQYINREKEKEFRAYFCLFISSYTDRRNSHDFLHEALLLLISGYFFIHLLVSFYRTAFL